MNNSDPQQSGVAGIFNRAAATYDQIGPQVYGYFGQRLVEIADVSPRSRVLDVATGRGAILFPLASQVGPYGKVIGIDLAQDMISQSAIEVRRRGLKHVEVHQMDGEELAFPDASFDWVLCGISIGFFPDPRRAFRDFLRVLKPGGGVGISTWPDDCPYVEWCLEALNASLAVPNSQSAVGKDEPGLNSPVRLKEALLEVGFDAVRTLLVDGDFVFSDGEEWWSTMWSHGLRGKIENLDAPELARVKAEMLQKVKALQQSDGVHNHYRCLFALGTKPED